MNTHHTFDVCIVGAGPAGTTTSLFLSKYNIDHLLIERAIFPRNKVCGESFYGRVSHVLREIDESWAENLFQSGVLTTSRQINVTYGKNGKALKIRFPADAPPIVKCKRVVFDKLLLDKALESEHVKYLEGCNICKFEKEKQGWQLTDISGTTIIKTQLLILAIGDKPIHLRQILPNYRMDGVEWLATRRYYKANDAHGIGLPGETFIFSKPLPYTVYTTPLSRDCTMIELMIDKKFARKINYKLEALLEQTIRENAVLSTYFNELEMTGKAEGVSMLLGTNPRSLSWDNTLVVGSAIGSIHPVTGNGVGHAMRSGQIAAFWAGQSLRYKNQSATFLQQYNKAIKQRFRMDYVKGFIYAYSIKVPRIALPLSRLLVYIQIFEIKFRSLPIKKLMFRPVEYYFRRRL